LEFLGQAGKVIVLNFDGLVLERFDFVI